MDVQVAVCQYLATAVSGCQEQQFEQMLIEVLLDELTRQG
jgi:hypothetical protein